MSTATTEPALTDAERARVDAYRRAVISQTELFARVAREGRFGSGSSPYHLAVALTGWWQKLEQLGSQLPDTPGTRGVVDAELRGWFQGRQAFYLAAAEHLVREGMLGDPGIPRPEDQDGRFGADGFFGYCRAERVTVTEPVEVTVRVDVDGSATLIGR